MTDNAPSSYALCTERRTAATEPNNMRPAMCQVNAHRVGGGELGVLRVPQAETNKTLKTEKNETESGTRMMGK